MESKMESTTFKDGHRRAHTSEVWWLQLLFLTLKVKEGATDKECPQPLEAKGEENDSTPPHVPRASRRLRPMADCWAAGLGDNESALFEATRSVAISFSCHEEWIHRASLHGYGKLASSHPLPSGQCSWSTRPFVLCPVSPSLTFQRETLAKPTLTLACLILPLEYHSFSMWIFREGGLCPKTEGRGFLSPSKCIYK